MTGGDVWLDAAGGVPPSPAVARAMADAAARLWAHDTGVHDRAAATADALDEARGRVAALIGAPPDEVVFTSGPVESRVTAVAGLREGAAALGDHAVGTALEHPSTLWALRRAEARGCPFTAVAVEADGAVAPAAVAGAVTDRTAVVCLHHGQEDVGTVNDVPALVDAARGAREDVRVFVDACATAGLVPVDVAAWGADAVAVGGAALGVPGGIGALWVRPGARMIPLLGGTAQEGGRRAGAVNVAGAVGMGVAAQEAAACLDGEARRRRALGSRLWDGLRALGDVRLNGPPVEGRIPGNVHVSVGGVTGETLAVTLAAHGVAVSPGSACSALAGKSSPVLEAMGQEPPWTLASILATIGPGTGEGEVDAALSTISAAVAALRAHSLARP